MVSAALLIAGVAVQLVAVLGLTVMRDPLDRLHYVGLAGYGGLLVGVAVLVRHGFSLIGDKSLLTGVLLVTLGPVVVHVTARSFLIRRSDSESGDARE